RSLYLNSLEVSVLPVRITTSVMRISFLSIQERIFHKTTELLQLRGPFTLSLERHSTNMMIAIFSVLRCGVMLHQPSDLRTEKQYSLLLAQDGGFQKRAS